MPERVEEARYSTLRVTRHAIVTPELQESLAQLGNIARRFFAPSGGALVYDVETWEEQLEPGHKRKVSGVKIESVDVYKPGGIKLSVFERRAPTTMKLARSFARAKEWAMAPTHPAPKEPGSQKRPTQPNPLDEALHRAASKYEIDNPNELRVTGTMLIPSLNPDYAQRGREYGLIMDPTQPETQYLYDEAEIVYGALNSIRGSAANRVLYPTTRSTLYIPIMRTPAEADPYVTASFLGCVQDDYLPIEIKLGGQNWDDSQPRMIPS